MSISTFLENTKAQIKSAVSTHPIAIFLISAFAIGILFISLAHILGIVFHGLCH